MRVYELPQLVEIGQKTLSQLKRFPVGVLRYNNAHLYTHGLEENLYRTNSLIRAGKGAKWRKILIEIRSSKEKLRSEGGDNAGNLTRNTIFTTFHEPL
jgi:hypothetical protein